MASSRDTLNGPDWKDVAKGLEAFQQENGLQLNISLTFCGTTLKPDLLMEVYSDMQLDDCGEVERSVCVRNRFSRMRVKNLEAAILMLLYQLDYALVDDKVISGETQIA